MTEAAYREFQDTHPHLAHWSPNMVAKYLEELTLTKTAMKKDGKA